MAGTSLHKLFVEGIWSIYDAEKQLTKALPKMAKAAKSEELRAEFEEHLEITRMQVNRLEEVFKSIGIAARPRTCEGMKRLIEQGQEMMQDLEKGATLDAALIASAQKIEHYEIASYATLTAFAAVRGMHEAEELLRETLAEEKKANERLTDIASDIDLQARYDDFEPSPDQSPADIMILFDETLDPRAVKNCLGALADFFRACGGAGLQIRLAQETILSSSSASHVKRQANDPGW